jgi:hypothetical protein
MKNKVIDLFGHNSDKNEGVKYSTLLEKFIAPFAEYFSEAEYAEDIFDFAINAWNFGNMKTLLPDEDFQITVAMIEEQNDEFESDLLLKMIDFKVSKFKEFTNFFVDFELTETKSDPILTVTTQPEDVYLSEMINDFESGNALDEFEEDYINRSAIILKPRKPFLDWLSVQLPDDDFMKDYEESNIYLIDDEIDDIEKWLKKKFDKFFKMELDAWGDNEEEWPQHRTYKMFKQWFQIDVSNMVYDMEKKPVLKSIL